MDPQEKGRQQVARNREENEETRELLTTAFALARSLSIKTLVVQADENRDVRLATKLREDERLIWFVRRQEKLAVPKPAKDVVLPVCLPETSSSSRTLGIIEDLALAC